MREYWLDPPGPEVVANCERCGCDIYRGIESTIPATWDDGTHGLICEDCIADEEQEYLLKVG